MLFRSAVTAQRQAHIKEEEDAMVLIRKAGGEIVELTTAEHQAFVDAVKPIYGEARQQIGNEPLALAGL